MKKFWILASAASSFSGCFNSIETNSAKFYKNNNYTTKGSNSMKSSKVSNARKFISDYNENPNKPTEFLNAINTLRHAPNENAQQESLDLLKKLDKKSLSKEIKNRFKTIEAKLICRTSNKNQAIISLKEWCNSQEADNYSKVIFASFVISRGYSNQSNNYETSIQFLKDIINKHQYKDHVIIYYKKIYLRTLSK